MFILVLTITYERLTHGNYFFYNKCFYRNLRYCISNSSLAIPTKLCEVFISFVLLWAQTLVGIAKENSYAKFQIKM